MRWSGIDVRSNGAPACSLWMTSRLLVCIHNSQNSRTARRPEHRIHALCAAGPVPPPPPRWRRQRQRRGPLARSLNSPLTSLIHPSSFGLTHPRPPLRWNHPNPPGHRRRRRLSSSSSSFQRLRDPGGRATPVPPSSSRYRSSASTSSPTYTASTYLSVPFLFT